MAGLRVEHQAPSEEEDGGEEQDERLLVHPGLAIDPRGRLIEIPRAACFRLGRWFEQQTIDNLTIGIVENYAIGIDDTDEDPGGTSNVTGVIVDVYVRFVACARGKTPAFAAGPFDALDAVSPSRLRDSYELSLLIRKETDPPSPTRPFVPLASMIQSKNWFNFWAFVGIRNLFQKNKGWKEVARLNHEYSQTGIHYEPRSKVKEMVLDIFGNIKYPSKEYLKHSPGGAARLGRRISNYFPIPFYDKLLFSLREQVIFSVK